MKRLGRNMFFILMLAPALAFADSFNFTNLSQSQFEDVSKEISGDLMHHSVQGAAPLGSIFGFEVGLVGGKEATPKLDEVVTQSGGSGASSLYHGGLLGVVSVPFGITGEVMMLPKMSSNGASLQSTSAALKLSLNSDLLKVLPFNLALRGFMTSSKFSFDQDNSGTTVHVDDESKVNGFQIIASPSLPVFEPYVGIGMLSAKNSLSGNGGSIFAPGYTTSTSSDVSLSSSQILLGVTANLLFFHVGAEYSNAFGASTYTGKLAFGF